jgi:hypothetical protein
MPTSHYYRKQAQLFARLAVTTSEPHIAESYNRMALEQLARAGEVEASTERAGTGATVVEDGGEMDRT